jgi:peptidoglycan/xylan/chitin deacetylase (PgdA/CDA1 family)
MRMLKLPILMYHEIIASRSAASDVLQTMHPSYFVTAAAFEEQLRLLRDGGFHTVTVEQLAQSWADPEKNPLPERSVMLTFDDGYAGNYTQALPLLQRYGMTAVFFIATGLVGERYMMAWEQLAALRNAGMSVQSHTMTHRFLRQLPDIDIERELRGSKEILETRLGAAVTFVSLPHGSYGKTYPAIARQAGYAGGCCSRIGYTTSTTGRYALRRIHVAAEYTSKEFGRIVSGAGWFVPLLAAKQGMKIAGRELVGEPVYDRLYRMVFRVKEQQHGR